MKPKALLVLAVCLGIQAIALACLFVILLFQFL